MPLSLLYDLLALDYEAVIRLNQFIFKWPPFDLFLTWLIHAHIVKFTPMLLVMCWLWFGGTPRHRLNRQFIVEAVLAGFAALFIARCLAFALPFRPRPLANPDLHLVAAFDTALRTWSSFPSDHAVLAFALATPLFRVSPKIGLWAFLHATIIVCLPRLYFGLHYPSDLLGGALIGISVAFAIALFQRRYGLADLLLDKERKHPAMFYAMSFLVLLEIAEMFDSIRGIVVDAFRILRQLSS